MKNFKAKRNFGAIVGTLNVPIMEGTECVKQIVCFIRSKGNLCTLTLEEGKETQVLAQASSREELCSNGIYLTA